MAGTIAIQEERGFLDKIREFYQEKIINSGLSEQADKAYTTYMNLSAKAANAIIKATGTASEIVLSVVNIDGELGETIANAITEILPNIITAVAQFNAKATVGAKNFFEQKIMGVEKEQEPTTYVDKENISVMKDKLKETLNQIKKMKFAESQNNQTNETVIDGEFREVPIDDGPRMGM